MAFQDVEPHAYSESAHTVVQEQDSAEHQSTCVRTCHTKQLCVEASLHGWFWAPGAGVAI